MAAREYYGVDNPIFDPNPPQARSMASYVSPPPTPGSPRYHKERRRPPSGYMYPSQGTSVYSSSEFPPEKVSYPPPSPLHLWVTSALYFVLW